VIGSEFLAPLIGEPWAWQSRNGWDFACHVQRELFGRELPHLSVPDGFSRRWVIEEFAHHAERRRWRQVPDGPGGLVHAEADRGVLPPPMPDRSLSGSGVRLSRFVGSC